MKSIQIKDKWKPHIVFAVFVFALYGNTLNHSFVFDDGTVLAHNRFTQQGVKGIPAIFKYSTFAGNLALIYDGMDADPLNEKPVIVTGGRYRPLSLVTFALEIEFFGKECTVTDIPHLRFRGNAFVSHLVNILMYLFTACLLFLLFLRLFPPDKHTKWYLSFPFVATLLFAAHPIHTEVVANIKGRDEIMALLGSLGALWFMIKYMDTHKYHHLALGGLCLFLGLLSKENTITFVAVIPVTLYYFVNHTKKDVFITMIPILVASALFLIIRASAIGPIDTSEDMGLLNNPFIDATKSETFATVFYTLLLYIKLLLFPHPLTYDYYPHHIEIVNWLNPVAILSLLFYLGIGMYAVYGLVKKRDVFSWSIWLYLLPLSVVSNLFFPIGVFMGERFIYFSSIGFAVCTAWLICRYVPGFMFKVQGSRFKVQSSRYFVVAVVGIILCLYSVKTITRNRAWKDNFILFTTDIKTSKNSAKGNYHAGVAFLNKAMLSNNKDNITTYWKEADRYLKYTIQLYPQYFDAIVQIGYIHAVFSGDIAQSLHYYAIALQYESLLTERIDIITREILNMTNLLLDDNQVISTPEEILRSCDFILNIRPDRGEALFVKGVIYGKYLNNLELALSYLEQALAMDFPKTVRFYEYLGAAYGKSGNYPNALQYLLKAEETGTVDIDTYLNLGVIYEQIGDMENARLYTSKGQEMLNYMNP